MMGQKDSGHFRLPPCASVNQSEEHILENGETGHTWEKKPETRESCGGMGKSEGTEF